MTHNVYFPQDPMAQLFEATKAVFKSWNNQRAKVYREIHHISDHLGTAVNIQSMVFCNSGNNSGTGVVFTRNPSTVENKLFGEFLVSGIRTPETIESLQSLMPTVYKEFVHYAKQLENH